MSGAPRIFVTVPVPDVALELLERELPEARVVQNTEGRTLTPEELAERARGAVALLCTLTDSIDRALLERLAPPLRIVSTFAVGVDNITDGDGFIQGAELWLAFDGLPGGVPGLNEGVVEHVQADIFIRVDRISITPGVGVIGGVWFPTRATRTLICVHHQDAKLWPVVPLARVIQ